MPTISPNVIVINAKVNSMVCIIFLVRLAYAGNILENNMAK